MRIIVPIFIDDITFAGTSTSAIEKAVAELKSHLKLRDLGPTEFLLGIGITRDFAKGTISLSQHQYILYVLERFGMSDCKPVTTPTDPGSTLSTDLHPKTDEEIAEMRNVPYFCSKQLVH